jgi:transcriptional regulator with XRE-family HTH domain
MTEHFGERLRRLRGEKSQREVATALEIPTTTLSSLEQQQTVPRGPMLQRLSGYFGVDPDYFFPAGKKESSAAREWLRAQRSRSFNVVPTVATYSIWEISQDEKERLDTLIGEKKVAKP